MQVQGKVQVLITTWKGIDPIRIQVFSTLQNATAHLEKIHGDPDLIDYDIENMDIDDVENWVGSPTTVQVLF